MKNIYSREIIKEYNNYDQQYLESYSSPLSFIYIIVI